MTTREDRVQLLEDAKLNVFKLRAEDVILDFLTDSGTGAMSAKQWGAIMEGDESYAGARSFFRLQGVLQKLTGYEHIIPTHQGRAAERILFGVATSSPTTPTSTPPAPTWSSTGSRPWTWSSPKAPSPPPSTRSRATSTWARWRTCSSARATGSRSA
jgi:hypothetical protein